MLQTILSIREKVDLSKYAKLMPFLRRKNIGYQAKKASTFTQQNVN